MTSAPLHGQPRNPFATRFTRPGALEPLDGNGRPVDAAGLLPRLLPGRILAIEGPHGHGKSTLLAAVMTAAHAIGWNTAMVRVRSPLESWRPVVTAIRAPRGGLVGCDGWERAAPGTAAVIRLVAAARRLRVVVTTHRPAGLPILARLGTTPRLLSALVARLPDHGGLISADDVRDAFDRHAGDLREALYDLYDRFERRARGLRPPAAATRRSHPSAGRVGGRSADHGREASRP